MKPDKSKWDMRLLALSRKAVNHGVTPRNELRDHPQELLNHPSHFLDDHFGQTKLLGLKRSIWVVLVRWLNGPFWRDSSYLILDVEWET